MEPCHRYVPLSSLLISLSLQRKVMLRPVPLPGPLVVAGMTGRGYRVRGVRPLDPPTPEIQPRTAGCRFGSSIPQHGLGPSRGSPAAAPVPRFPSAGTSFSYVYGDHCPPSQERSAVRAVQFPTDQCAECSGQAG